MENTNNYDSYLSHILNTPLAKKIAKEIAIIYSDDRYSDLNSTQSYPLAIYLYDTTMLSQEALKLLSEKNTMSFATFNREKAVNEIYIGVETDDELKKFYNPISGFYYRGKFINIGDDITALRTYITVGNFLHELGHIKITGMDKMPNKILENFLEKNKIPFALINLFEDVRVNTYWNKNKDSFNVLYNQIYKLSNDIFSEDKTGLDIIGAVCITLNDKKYTYKSPDYPFCESIFNKLLKANSIMEIAVIAKEFLDKMRDLHPDLTNRLQNGQNGNLDKSPQNREGENKGQTNSPFQSRQKEKSQTMEENQRNEKEIADLINQDDPEEDVESDEIISLEDLLRESEKNTYETRQNQIGDKSEEKDEGLKPSAEALFSDDSGDIKAGLDERLKILRAEIKNKSFTISPEGVILKKPKEKNPVSIVYNILGNKDVSRCNNSLELFPSANSVIKNDIMGLNRQTLKKLEKETIKILSMFFPKTNLTKSSRFSEKLNERKLYTIPTNPLMNNLFLEKNKKQKKPTDMTFFVDLSGSMSYSPIFIAKHLLANIYKMQTLGYVNANFVLHSRTSYNKAFCDIVKLSNLKTKGLERIANIETSYGDEGIVNAVDFANRTIRNDLKNSKLIVFITDANLCEEAKDIRNALAKLPSGKVLGLYTGEKEDSKMLSKYFSMSIKPNFDKINESSIEKIALSLNRAIAKLANPDVTTKKILKDLEKDDNLIIEDFEEIKKIKEKSTIKQENISNPRSTMKI